MSNWDYTEEGHPARNFETGRFLKGHIPHNKGKKWSEWMDGRKAKKVLRIGARNLKGRPDIGGWNARKIVAVRETDGKWWCFESAAKAALITGLIRRNITRCCQGKAKHCGAFRWFYWDDEHWAKLVKEYESIQQSI